MRSFAVRLSLSLVVLLGARSVSRAGIEAVEGGIRFTYTDPSAGVVFLAGAFNNWNARAMPLTKDDSGVWSVVVPLGAGKHEYKFVVDNQWVADPENPVTAGEYGNSLARVGEDGGLVAMAATANTAYSAKILLGGRMISRLISSENRERGRRYELGRPTMDFDLDWLVRANDYLDLHMLTSINNEDEETVTDFWKTNLRFDRGSIRLHTGNLKLKMFDNESAGRFDDPLTLVGGIGIYDHDFGFRQQGAITTFHAAGGELTLLYADDFENGGTTTPTLDPTSLTESGTTFDSTESVYRWSRSEVAAYDFIDDDNDKDVFALRATYPLPGLRIGTSYRADRGYNPGALSLVLVDEGDTTGTTGVRKSFEKTLERWWGAGGDLLVGGGEKPYSLRTEFLHGRAEILAFDGMETAVRLGTDEQVDEVFDETVYTPSVDETAPGVSTGDERFEIDRSTRIHAGGDLRLEGIGLDLGATWEREKHEQTYYATGTWDTLANTADIVRVTATREIRRFLGREWKLGVRVETFRFDYDARTPWRNQFWFDERNFWLEQSEHEVSVDRMVLVGGRNASFVRPSLTAELWPSRSVDFAWHGTFAGIDLDKDPKYTENLFQITARPWKKVRLYSDTRFVKYTDPVLGLFGSYWSTFAEVAYEVSDGIDIALSYGVDPYVIDETTNEFDSIGRDLFLFGRGANGDAARRNFPGLGTALPEAEQALEDERRIQIEGIVRF